MGAYRYTQELWRKKLSDIMCFLLRVHGYVICQVHVRHGGHKHPVPKGAVYSKPAHHGVNQLKFAQSLRSVILIEPFRKAIRGNPDTQGTTKVVYKHREIHGLGKGHKFHHPIGGSLPATWRRRNTLQLYRYH
ncbi:unnamed protein product [Nyctereutes procyonoides]|uniref:Ribosomal protein L15 n=1 Tax=Nyctereutes procyonoides TaxID=34880 RepID=A0A811YQX3_NYCPR|nr:unnamed protein product [Nyctereutes procyonoides]